MPKNCSWATVAQLVEHLTRNEDVCGSIPHGGSSFFYIFCELFFKEILMSEVPEYFVCDSCSNKDFVPIHNFGVRFHGVNFSDELIYDKIFEEKFQCTECLKVFSKTDIETALANLRIKRRKL